MSSPSIVPNDRLDRDFYIVLEDFRNGAAFRETEERMDYPTLITDLLSGQYSQVLRVVAFNPSEGWSRDASQDIARELEAPRLKRRLGDLRRPAGFHRGPARPQDRRTAASSVAVTQDSVAEAARVMKVVDATVIELERQGIVEALADLGFDPRRIGQGRDQRRRR